MTQVQHRSGQEGPRHDPYHFDEFTLNRPNGDTIVLHTGLATWARLQRGDKVILQNTDADVAHKLFEFFAGVSQKAFAKAWYSLPQRRLRNHYCGGVRRSQRDFECASGYPGESFVICSHCKGMIDFEFDRSAVE